MREALILFIFNEFPTIHVFQDMEGRRYMEYSNIYGAYNILVWFARKYPALYINDDTKETVLHYAAAQVHVIKNQCKICIYHPGHL